MQKRIDRLDASSFDWVLLRSFLAIFRAGTVAGAARNLGQQQSTLSRQLHELEAQLGTPLFERTGRGLHATDAAQLVAMHAQQMESLANQLALSLTASATDLAGTVRLSASQLFATLLLPPLVADLLVRHPGLQIELVAGDEVPNLLTRATDIALRFSQPEALDVVARKLGTMQIVAVAHRDYLAANGTPQAPSDLLGHTLLGLDKDEIMLRTLQRLDVPLTSGHFRVRVDDKAVYLKLLEAGVGIGFMAKWLMRGSPHLLQVLPDLALPSLVCWLSTHTGFKSNPLIRIVFDELAVALSARLAQD